MKWRSKLGQVLDTSQDGPRFLCSLKLHSCLRITHHTGRRIKWKLVLEQTTNTGEFKLGRNYEYILLSDEPSFKSSIIHSL